MLIPRFTLRWLLLVITFISVDLVIVAQAVRGRTWAISITAATASLLLCFFVYGALFGLAYILATMLGLTRRRVAVDTPFATAEPPVQMVPPEDPE